MKRIALAALVVAAASFAALRPASATVEMQKAAKGAGLEAKNCQYCHGEALPKKGASTLNDRGKWLQAEKDKRKADKIDPAWLKDYKEEKK